MHIGHINLARSCNGAGDNFVRLIESLQQLGVRQYVLVRNVELAKRLESIADVTVGPLVRSAVAAYCLVPTLDIVHVHEPAAAKAGLLLALTRSVPFVLTHQQQAHANNRIEQAIYKRAAAIIDDCDADGSRYLRIYRHAAASWRTSSVML
jgi:hypothetical protein